MGDLHHVIRCDLLGTFFLLSLTLRFVLCLLTLYDEYPASNMWIHPMW